MALGASDKVGMVQPRKTRALLPRAALVGRSSINTPRAIRVRIARSPVRRAAKPRASPAEDSVVVAAVPPPRAAAAAGSPPFDKLAMDEMVHEMIYMDRQGSAHFDLNDGSEKVVRTAAEEMQGQAAKAAEATEMALAADREAAVVAGRALRRAQLLHHAARDKPHAAHNKVRRLRAIQQPRRLN